MSERKRYRVQGRTEEYRAKVCLEMIISFLSSKDTNTKQLTLYEFQTRIWHKITPDDKQCDVSWWYVPWMYDRKHPDLYT